MSVDVPASADRTALPPAIDQAMELVFRSARTYRAWKPEPVAGEVLRSVYSIARLGPTSANGNPLRILFLTSVSEKARILPALDAGNVEKTRTAPVVAIFAYDSEFYEQFHKLQPGKDVRSRFASDPVGAERNAFQNSCLQAAYFMVVARAHGLDCGPMGGFNPKLVDETFFGDSTWKTNFICNLGHGDPSGIPPRAPRLEFDEACRIL